MKTKFVEFQQMGTVIRINNNKLYEELGYTSKHPRVLMH